MMMMYDCSQIKCSSILQWYIRYWSKVREENSRVLVLCIQAYYTTTCFWDAQINEVIWDKEIRPLLFIFVVKYQPTY